MAVLVSLAQLNSQYRKSLLEAQSRSSSTARASRGASDFHQNPNCTLADDHAQRIYHFSPSISRKHHFQTGQMMKLASFTSVSIVSTQVAALDRFDRSPGAPTTVDHPRTSTHISTGSRYRRITEERRLLVTRRRGVSRCHGGIA